MQAAHACRRGRKPTSALSRARLRSKASSPVNFARWYQPPTLMHDTGGKRSKPPTSSHNTGGNLRAGEALLQLIPERHPLLAAHADDARRLLLLLAGSKRARRLRLRWPSSQAVAEWEMCLVEKRSTLRAKPHAKGAKDAKASEKLSFASFASFA